MADASVGSIQKQGVFGDLKYCILAWTPGATAAAGGEAALALIQAATGIADILAVMDLGIYGGVTNATDLVFRYNDTSGKMQYYGDGGAVTAAAFAESTGNLAAYVHTILVLGK